MASRPLLKTISIRVNIKYIQHFKWYLGWIGLVRQIYMLAGCFRRKVLLGKGDFTLQVGVYVWEPLRW